MESPLSSLPAPSLRTSLPIGGGRRSVSFLLVLALAHAGGVIGYLPLLTLLLPVKVEALAGEARIGVLTACVIAGALAASLSNVLFGWLSDRSVARGGTRRPWIIAGLVGLALSYIVVALASAAATIVIGVVLFQIAVNAVLAPFFAIMAEEVPDSQKGVAGGLLALANPVASGFSAILVAAAFLGEAGRFVAVPAAVLVCCMPLLLTRARIAEGVAEAEQARPSARDLATAWSARLLVQVAGNVQSLYLLYYFESVAQHETPLALAGQVGQLLAIAYAVPLPVAVLVGRLSDRTGRRKPFLFAAAALATVGLAGMALAGSWAEGAIAFGFYAVGSAVFLALHSAFAMQLLPSARHRGRDLGLLNLTNTLPALLGPLLAWSLATPRDFSPLMLSLAGLTFCGGLLVLRAKGRA